MVAVLIRKLSDETHRALKARAKANGRSAEAEARSLLEAGLKTKVTGQSVAAVVAAWKRDNGGGVELTSISRSSEPLKSLDFE
jgi:antitoxin FitA